MPIPGARDVRASLDEPDSGTDRVVVACPPHPQHGGNRQDRRLRAVADELTDRGIACLRFDYGDWDGGYGECEDARNALRWATERYESVGLFGFSFGGCIALLAAVSVDVPVRAVVALAPADRISPDLDAVAAVGEIECPVRIVYGTRDTTVDSVPVADAARDRGGDVVELPADHFFVGQSGNVADVVVEFLVEHV